MISRLATCTLVAVALAAFVAAGLVRAAEKTHEGKLVSVSSEEKGKDGKLVMTDDDGKNEHSHPVLAKAKITLNKKSAKLDDLKKGDFITVTLNDESKVSEVAATRDTK